VPPIIYAALCVPSRLPQPAVQPAAPGKQIGIAHELCGAWSAFEDNLAAWKALELPGYSLRSTSTRVGEPVLLQQALGFECLLNLGPRGNAIQIRFQVRPFGNIHIDARGPAQHRE